MDDLISRQAAIELIENEYRKWGDEYGVSDVLCDLSDMPSAEPQRKKGKWVDETFEFEPWWVVHHPYKCNQCGERSEEDSNFCPNCGAEMEKG